MGEGHSGRVPSCPSLLTPHAVACIPGKPAQEGGASLPTWTPEVRAAGP